ncbi:GIY-YIG nuclease family protein [uncultured Pseudoramibacter sp.]|jgi:putative endonuclease|uniref:GIY-YIG nuclease family protein n=1 Tax=Candidatus Pseudoramibacter fermentans TaxID=2594427 RepID=A0A6L5GSL0_9FIRM|nr:GIY-YIG nuclease family protein [uncultured Pseudoramibacter sp.]MQM72846.1 GIY-YIG nuclease family protein [Candidatus Pseudoramibacter fermentans]RRF93802.1 MAG: GIY-YIG nuclease family protein [Eubacteriaceae bacterium]
MQFYTYIVTCSDGTFYTGYTNNLKKRIETHNKGKGSKYTRSRRPVRLSYYKIFETKHDAMSWEAIIKNRMTHNQKKELIEKNKIDYYNEHDNH